jgi:hypothetical protein
MQKSVPLSTQHNTIIVDSMDPYHPINARQNYHVKKEKPQYD